MAAVDRRLGVVRRGVTPAAPKPINLPSQKLENHRLVPDVEIVPRGTCCWGGAGRCTPASGKSNEKTDSATLPLEPNGLEDHGSEVQNDPVSTDEVESRAENSGLPLSVESSSASSTARVTSAETVIGLPLPVESSSASSTACLTSAETVIACLNLGIDVSNVKAGSSSPARSDAGSFPESEACPSSSESYSSASVTPIIRVEEQKQFSGSSEVCSGDYEKVSNIQVKQETHVSHEPLLGSQDFGYFEGLYSTQPPFSRPGMPYPNSAGMAFGPGMHPLPPQHYSFLGVPYYDSVKDKEIVVITMVGNPGVYGNYLPYPGFPDQYGRPSVYGNLPLQFGHFEHCVGPPVSVEMNPMRSNEDSGFTCYEQDNYKESWVNGNPAGNVQRDNGVCFPTSRSVLELNAISEDFIMPKRTGRQKFVNRNRRAAVREASPAVFAPERRVTLLTKVSQHEVIISNMQRKTKHGGARQAKSTYGPHFFSQNVTEGLSAPQPAQNSAKILVCAPQPEAVILPVEASSGFRVEVQTGAAIKSTDASSVAEIVEVEKSCAPDVLESLSLPDTSSLQLACSGFNSEESMLVLGSIKDTKTAVSEPSVASILVPSPLPISATTSTPNTTSKAQNEMAVQHQGSSTIETPCEVPASGMETSSVPADNTRFKSEVRCLSKVGEIQLDCPCNNLTQPEAFLELANECLNHSETTSAASLPKEHLQDSIQGLPAKKRNKKWRLKRSIDVTKLGHNDVNQKGQDFVADMRAFSCNDISRDAVCTADSLTSSSGKVEPVSAGSMSLSSCAPAALSSCDKSAVSSDSGHAMVSLVDMVPDRLCKGKDSGPKAGYLNGGFECAPEFCAVQALDSSNKTASAAEGQYSHVRTVSCGAGKKWRPKLSGEAGQDISAPIFFGDRSGKVATAPIASSLQVNKIDSASDCMSSKHVFESKVSFDDHGGENYKRETRVGVDTREYTQDKGCIKLLKTALLVPKVSRAEDHGREESIKQLSQSVHCRKDVQVDGDDKLSNAMQRSEDLSLTHGIRNNRGSLINSEEESISPLYLGKQGHTWRVVKKQVLQQKVSLGSKPTEKGHSNSVKSKESVSVVQHASQVSWKPKQSSVMKAFNDVSYGVQDNCVILSLQNEVRVEGKEQGNRRPFSMRSNFLNDDNKKAVQLQQSLSNSSAHVEPVQVRENLHIDYCKSHSSRRTYMKLGRRGEFHIAKKVDRKGWVVKTETAYSKA